MGLEEELVKLNETGKDALSHLVCLTQAHTLLLQLEIKERLWIFTRVLLVTIVVAIALGGALLCLSFALAGAISIQWPALGMPLSLIIVAFLDILLASLLLLYIGTLLRRALSLHFDSLKSWVSSLLYAIKSYN